MVWGAVSLQYLTRRPNRSSGSNRVSNSSTILRVNRRAARGVIPKIITRLTLRQSLMHHPRK